MSSLDYEDDLDFGPWSEPEVCDHEEYDVDWEGRATCDFCRQSWWLTAEQHEAWDRMVAACEDAYERERLRERNPLWRFWRWLLRQKPRWQGRIIPEPNDEIPF